MKNLTEKSICDMNMYTSIRVLYRMEKSDLKKIIIHRIILILNKKFYVY